MRGVRLLVVLALIVVGIFIGVFIYRFYTTRPTVGPDTAVVTTTVTTPGGTTTSTTVEVRRPAVWLIAGVDERDGGVVFGHNDSVILAFVRPSTVTLLSIPRDTLVYIPRLKGYTKLAHAFIYSKYGYPEDGAESLIETISYNFGVKVDRYIIFGFRGVEAAVDAIGGIDVYLPHRICYKRCIGPGNVHLDGRNFLLFWRARTTDLERIGRQMSFLRDPKIRKQIFDKLSPEVVSKLVGVWGKYIVSDTAPDAWLKLAYDIRDYHVETYVLRVTPEFGCYAQDLSIPVWVVKFDDQWLVSFYQREFGLAANLFIPGIKPDRGVGPFAHCIVEKPETPTTATTATVAPTASTASIALPGIGNGENSATQTASGSISTATTSSVTMSDSATTASSAGTASTSTTSISATEAVTATSQNTPTTASTSTTSTTSGTSTMVIQQ